jgi:mono/diheme cytochrome c family protein
MKRVVKVVFFVAVLSLTLAAVAQPPADSRDQGKNIFVSRCARCHDADASRKLPDGTNLLGRLAKSSEPKALLAGRLKDQHERDAVMLYLQPLIEHWRTPESGGHAPAEPQRPQ